MRYSLDEIETFLTVMALGSVTAAAARLNLSKSVVSKRIADFETALGAALFRRHAGRITPTEAAARLAERLRPALTELTAAAESAAWGMDGGDAPLLGRLTIAAPMSFGTRYLSPIIADFAAAHPALELRLDYDDRLHDLARDGFDVGVRVGAMRDLSLTARKLCEDRMIVCASPDYIAAHGAPETLAALTGHETIGYSHLPNAQLWRFGSLSPTVSGRLSCNNGEAMRDMAAAGLGLAMLPGFLAEPAIAAGRLIPVLTDHETRALPIAAVWPPVSPVPAKLRAFVDHLAAALAGGAPWRGAQTDG